VGEPLTIVGLYTEGNWYLLVDGLWILGDAVDNAPLAVPLVFPTMTPAPSPTPTPTFTPLPTATSAGTETPTPTATSLDEQVCDCSGDNFDCLGNIFANRGEAQRCFEYCFRQVGRDIHLLDANLNGMACENLPDVLPSAPLSVVPLSFRAAETGCDPNYTGECIPIVASDLNCEGNPWQDFLVVGTDRHGFDRDDDGLACESGE
jgi:hypothetical protein